MNSVAAQIAHYNSLTTFSYRRKMASNKKSIKFYEVRIGKAKKKDYSEGLTREEREQLYLNEHNLHIEHQCTKLLMLQKIGTPLPTDLSAWEYPILRYQV
jgi:hypothetical protein